MHLSAMLDSAVRKAGGKKRSSAASSAGAARNWPRTYAGPRPYCATRACGRAAGSPS